MMADLKALLMHVLSIDGLKNFFQIAGLSAMAATINVYLSKETFAFVGWLVNVFMSIMIGLAIGAICKSYQVDEYLTFALVSASTLVAEQFIRAIKKMADEVSKNPAELVKKVLRFKGDK